MNDPNTTAASTPTLDGTPPEQPGASNAPLDPLYSKVALPQRPSLARNVFYFPSEDDLGHEGVVLDNPLAAIIVGKTPAPEGEPEDDYKVNLQILCDSSLTLYKKGITFGHGEPGTWMWPPRI